MTRNTHPSHPLLTAPGTAASRRRAWVVGLMVPLVIASSGGAWPLGTFMLAAARQDQPAQQPPSPQPPTPQPPSPQPPSPQPEAQPPQPSTPTAATPKERAEAIEAARRKVEADRARFEEIVRERTAKAAQDGGERQRPPLVGGVNVAQPVPAPGDPRNPGEPNPNAQGEQGIQELPNPDGEVIDVPNPEGAAVPGMPVAPAPDAEPNPAVGALVGKDTPLSLNFTDPIDLVEFIKWVSKSLNINIIADEGLAGRRIVFHAPVKVRADELLQLLSRLIEDQDYIFSKDPLGFYTIKSSAKIPIVLAGEGVDLPTTRIIPTPMVRPSIMQQAVQQAMGGGGGPGAQGGARITSIDDIGVMIVTGSAGALATVESLVQTIQHELTNQKLHRFTLEHVSADFALNRILTLNGKVSQQAGGFNPGGGVPVNQGGGGAGGVSGSLTHLDSRLFIDPGNAIIFRGTDSEAEQVKVLLAVIDVVNTLIAKRYATGSVTSDVAAAGERIGLGPATQSGSSSNSSFSGGFSNFRNQGGGFNGQQGGGSGTSDLPGSGFAVDMEKGSIIYYGTESQHALVAQLVKTFTEQALNEDVEIRAYKLLYAKAEKVAEVLNSLLENPNDRTANSSFLPRSNTNRGTSSPLVTPPEPAQTTPTGSAGDEGATLTATKNDTVVVPDEDRNQILVKASGRQQREFARIIKKLDERQPQVYIEAKIVAVRVDDTFTYRSDLQIDADAFQFLSSFGLTAPAANAVFNDRRNVVNPGTGTSGVTAALLNQDRVLGVIQALQVVGDARIVSTPRILVNDNEEAKQQSVREEPFAATSQTSGNPTVTSQGGTATAGTSLTVTPTISQNGDIVLEYAIELSNFDRSATANANLQPPKQTENYESKVTVPSDTTIVVGGFTFESKQNTENKVPFLGDIPIVGLLFKSIGEVTNRTTIFVFITPRVLTDPTGADLRILTEGPMREMKIDGITPSMSPESIAISPSAIALPKLDQTDRTPGAIDPGHTPRRTPFGAPNSPPSNPPASAPDGPAARPTLDPMPEPALTPETMPEPTPAPTPVTQAGSPS